MADFRKMGQTTFRVQDGQIYRTGSDRPSLPQYVSDTARQSADAAQSRSLFLKAGMNAGLNKPGEAQRVLRENQYDQGVAESARDALSKVRALRRK